MLLAIHINSICSAKDNVLTNYFMHTLETVKNVISRVSYKDWKFVILKKEDGFLLQCQFMGEDTDGSGKLELQKCRKWYISAHSCDSEIVRTCFLAVQQAEIHEIHERFKYKGQAVHNPHVDMDKMADFIINEPFQTRQETIKEEIPLPILYTPKTALFKNSLLSHRAKQGICLVLNIRWGLSMNQLSAEILNKFSKKEFLTYRNCGRKTLKEIESFANKCGIKLLP